MKEKNSVGRPPKASVKVSYTLDAEVAKALEKFCNETGRTKTRVVELAVMDYIKNHTEK